MMHIAVTGTLLPPIFKNNFVVIVPRCRHFFLCYIFYAHLSKYEYNILDSFLFFVMDSGDSFPERSQTAGVLWYDNPLYFLSLVGE
jgi:hypothetical protein